MIAADLTSLLAKRYCAPEFAFLSQVRNQTGYASHQRIRTADGVALGLYPSRGINLHGFEIKVSRGDWLAEKKNPDKADSLGKYCNYWWIVVPDINTVVPHELPDSWGLLVSNGNELKIARNAHLMIPEQITLPVIAGIFRNLSESVVPKDYVDEKVKQEVAKIIMTEKWKANYEVDECRKLRKRIEIFEKRSGLKIDDWYLEDVADAVRVIKDNQSGKFYNKLNDIRETAQDIIEKINETLKVT
jgi:hypothetical protein